MLVLFVAGFHSTWKLTGCGDYPSIYLLRGCGDYHSVYLRKWRYISFCVYQTLFAFSSLLQSSSYQTYQSALVSLVDAEVVTEPLHSMPPLDSSGKGCTMCLMYWLQSVMHYLWALSMLHIWYTCQGQSPRMCIFNDPESKLCKWLVPECSGVNQWDHPTTWQLYKNLFWMPSGQSVPNQGP